MFTCPANKTLDPGLTQVQIDSAYAAWLASAKVSGGCNTVLTNNSTGSPSCNETFTITFTVTSSCEAAKTCSATFTVPPCVFCSYTQGFWGNKNGLALLQSQSLLATDLVIGRTGHSILIPAGSSTTLNGMMPGGQTPTGPLKGGNCSILSGCINSYLTKQGKFNNVLISQTITLALNIRVHNSGSGNLATLKLGNGCLKVNDSSFTINQNVLDYLHTSVGPNATVGDLLNLANDVLGAVKTPGVNGVPSYSDINDAVTAINEGFDECRTFFGYCEQPAAQSRMITSGKTAEQKSIDQLNVSAYPNPYNDKVRFVIESPVSGQGTLEVYNTLGQKMQTVFKGYIFAHRGETVDYTVPTLNRTNLIYILKIGNKQVTGKLLHLN